VIFCWSSSLGRRYESVRFVQFQSQGHTLGRRKLKMDQWVVSFCLSPGGKILAAAYLVRTARSELGEHRAVIGGLRSTDFRMHRSAHFWPKPSQGTSCLADAAHSASAASIRAFAPPRSFTSLWRFFRWMTPVSHFRETKFRLRSGYGASAERCIQCS